MRGINPEKDVQPGIDLIHWYILEKDMVDEIVFRTTNLRTRIMLELMSRAGMRINEVLNLSPADIQNVFKLWLSEIFT
jgi:integrase